MPKAKTYETLEFNQITQAVKRHSQTYYGSVLIENMKFETAYDHLNQKQGETEEALGLILQNKAIPIAKLDDLSPILSRLRIGAYLNGKELATVGRLLSTVEQLEKHFENLAQEDKSYEALEYWVEKLQAAPTLLRRIEKTVEEHGEVKSSASETLSRLRRSQANTEHKIREKLNELVKNRSNQLSDQLITIRNERYVLPVKAEYRQAFGGLVHDQSSSGQTLYIEPQTIVDLNSKLSELKVQEQSEIERILAEISTLMMPYVDELANNERLLGQLDFIQARAFYARELNATRPSFSKECHVEVWQARHPLIPEDEIVANDIIIGEDYKTLLITGPNTGGKTILLKTLGILQLMGQAGLHIPAEAGSTLGIFDGVYADIGDEQSIEQSLSTFSGHMTTIIKILEVATDRSLLLFDELGSGTDPQEGASLAIAILNYTRKINATVMATTHYPELKVYAHETPGTINASMEFDSNSLSPTYKLLIGIPGRSNALEISQRLGLPEEILEDARRGVSQDSQSLNELVANVESKRRTLEEDRKSLDEKIEEAQALYDDLNTEYKRFMDNKERLLEEARQVANEKIEEAQDEAEKIIQEIRDLQLEQGQSVVKEHVLIDKRSSLDALKVPKEVSDNKVLKRAKAKESLKVGDEVEVKNFGQRGSIIEKLDQENYLVQIGIMKLQIHKSDLEKVDTKPKAKRKVNVQRQAGSKVQTSLDLRGQRYDEAMRNLSEYIDRALLSNHPRVTIIHGKGTGALREGVWKYLRKHPQVESFEFSPPNAGGDGSTVVKFKG